MKIGGACKKLEKAAAVLLDHDQSDKAQNIINNNNNNNINNLFFGAVPLRKRIIMENSYTKRELLTFIRIRNKQLTMALNHDSLQMTDKNLQSERNTDSNIQHVGTVNEQLTIKI
jgi:hypothetical protein